MNNQWVKVDIDEFKQFIKDYGKPLEYDICRTYEPPIETFNDLSDGKKWPETVVARIFNEYQEGDASLQNAKKTYEVRKCL